MDKPSKSIDLNNNLNENLQGTTTLQNMSNNFNESSIKNEEFVDFRSEVISLWDQEFQEYHGIQEAQGVQEVQEVQEWHEFVNKALDRIKEYRFTPEQESELKGLLKVVSDNRISRNVLGVEYAVELLSIGVNLSANYNLLVSGGGVEIFKDGTLIENLWF